MIVRELDYVKGNIAVKPERKSTRTDNDRKRELRNKRRKKKELQKKNYIRKSSIQIAAIIFFVGMVTISRDAKVYTMQKELDKLDTEIETIKDENEALRVNLLKIGSLDNIKTQAEERLNMSIATKENTMEIEVPSNYFEEEKEDTEDTNKTLFSKLLDAFK
ncbi:cell division protein FtsL [uncultured Clostridium sp.]|uniref:cell division protein FtsL n=1 Tax=uncultured Clostridium sp. TaxID=59620 RepID=UPI0025DF93C8|nr:cell division protein FtsL [uncultured Clostridium sp.]